MNYKKITLDTERKSFESIVAMQGDNKSRYIKATIVNKSIPLDLTGCAVKFSAIKPDMTDIFNDAVITNATLGEVEIELTNQTLAVPGVIQATLVILKEDMQLSVLPFFITVIENPYNPNAIESKSEYKALNNALTTAEGYAKELQDASVNLEEKYTTRLNNFGEQLDTIASLPLKLKCDGVTDDSVAFQELIDNVTDNTEILFSKGKILLTKPIIINKDNVTIDMRNCEIVWNGTDDVQDGRERDKGIFTIEGTCGEKQNISDVSFVSDFRIPNRKCTQLKVENLDQFEIGDYVEFKYSTGVNTYETYFPQMETLCRVVDKNEYLVLDYFSPFIHKGLTISGTIAKVKPAENITIKNIKIHDITEGINESTTTDGANRSKCITGISMKYAAYINIENIYAKNMKLPIILSQFSYRCDIKNIYNDNPAYVGPGEGYAVQINRSMLTNLNNIYGNNERHIFDFSWASFCTAKNCNSSYGKQTSITLHGCCEHDILIENCVGAFNGGSGIEYFPCLNSNITLRNFDGTVGIDYCENMIIESSNVVLRNFRPYTCKIENSKVIFRRGIEVYPRTRGREQKLASQYSYLIISDCEISGTRDRVDEMETLIYDYHDFKIIGGKYYDEDNINRFGANNFVVQDIVNVTIDNVSLYNMYLVPKFTKISSSTINIKNNVEYETKLKNNTSFILLDENTGDIDDLIINIDNNTFINKSYDDSGTLKTKRLMKIVDATNSFSDSNIILNFKNNVCKNYVFYNSIYDNVLRISKDNKFINCNNIGDYKIAYDEITELIPSATNWSVSSGVKNELYVNGDNCSVMIDFTNSTGESGSEVTVFTIPDYARPSITVGVSFYIETDSDKKVVRGYLLSSGNVKIRDLTGAKRIIGNFNYIKN